ncbi:hypothetical protein BKI52_26020 [marine bacterium AO1-C]|nr:hypothetical protein BKI52_26020 [marine bacterium AO1-C]
MLTVESYASQGVVTLLENNTIGTPGESILYKHKTTPQKLATIGKHHFVSLTRGENVFGTACLCRRQIFLKNQPQEALYIRYFTVNEKYRRKGAKSQWKLKGRLKQEIQALLEGKLLENSDQAMFYAYVDPENERSARICAGFGFQRVGSFVTNTFSRIYLRKHPGVTKAKSKEILQEAKLHQHFESFDFFFPEYVQEFYVLRKGQEILAYAHAQKDNWEILSLPGKSGKFMLQILPKVPLLGRLFSRDYHFARIDTVFCKPGQEKQLERLFTHILADLGVYSALIPVATEGKLQQQLQKINLGLLAKFSNNKPIDLIAKNIPVKLKINDFYIASFDIT